MNEIKSISRDIRSGSLPASELPRFALWLVLKNIGKASIIIVIASAIALALIR